LAFNPYLGIDGDTELNFHPRGFPRSQFKTANLWVAGICDFLRSFTQFQNLYWQL